MKISRVHLAAGSTSSHEVDRGVVTNYLGGLGLCARLMADVPHAAKAALDPDLPLFIAAGSLTGTGFPGANRTCVFGVSPLTSIMAGSWMGGPFGEALARTGTICLSLEGKAPSPSIVVVRPEGARVLARPDLWGLPVSTTRGALQEEYPEARMAIIGPAGENQVRMANIRGDEGHAAGRCGLGAVLGSKNVKAVVVHGKVGTATRGPRIHNRVIREANLAVRDSRFLSDIQGPVGTPNLVRPVNEFDALPTGNHRERHFDGAEQIYGERIARGFVRSRTTCPHCSVRCRLHVGIDEATVEAPEYESLWSLGADNCVDDYPQIVRGNELCNELGLDTISTGNVIAFYREYQGELEDPSTVLPLIEDIAFRRGAGALLAEGARKAAQTLGVDYAMHVKGLELSAYDPRKLTGMAISYSTANRGGCHSRAWTVEDELTGRDFSAEELAQMVAAYHDAGCVRDSLIVCTFLDHTLQPFYAEALSTILDQTYDEDSLALIGERIYTLERTLNVQRGVHAALDALPARLREGMVSPEKYAEAMSIYYRLRGWDERGCPTPEKLSDLGLGFMLDGMKVQPSASTRP